LTVDTATENLKKNGTWVVPEALGHEEIQV
jgi:hypothetical protein